MATSNSYNFSINAQDIVKGALRKIGALRRGEELDDDDAADAYQALNLIARQWAGRSDYGASFKMWTRERAFLILQSDQVEYKLGPASTDDHATSVDDLAETTLSANAASGATSVNLTSVTGVSDGDNIGILLSSDTIFWTTINGDPAVAGDVVLTTALSGAANANTNVFVYTDKIQKPIDLLTLSRRESNGDDIHIDYLSLEQYESLPDKDQTGEAVEAYFEERRLNSLLFIDAIPTDLTDKLRFTYLRPIQDFDSANDNPDFPAIWERALVYQLAIDLAPEHDEEVSNVLVGLRDEAVAVAMNDNPENSTTFFEPDRPEYDS